MFIDALHTFDDTRELIELYLPRLRPGGVLAGHDFTEPTAPGIRQAVEATVGDDYRVTRSSFVHRKAAR